MKKKEEKGLVKATKVVARIDLVNQQIEALNFIRTSKFKTSGKYEGRDIKAVKTIPELIDIHSSIKARVDAYDASAKALGLKKYKTKTFDNATLEDWTEDIKLQIQVIEHDSTLKELETWKKEYEELMDKEDRLAALDAKFAKRFGE